MIDEPEPTIQSPRQVKIRMLEVGVCGTDKEICRFEYGTPPAGSDHLVLGHECLGEVVEVGDGVSAVRPGDLAVVMVRRPCPHPECRACRAGRQDFCYTGDFTERGIKEASGFMAAFIVEEETYVVPVPRELRSIAVLTEPLTIAEKAFTQLLDIQERLPWISPATGSEPPLTGRKALILGAGPVGLLGALKFLAAGCETIVFSRETASSEKARFVASLGARYVSSADRPAMDLGQVLGGVDVVYEATGASALAFEVLNALSANGVFIFTGVPGRKYPAQVDTGAVMRNMVLQNQVVVGTVNAGRDSFEAAVRDLEVFRSRFGSSLEQLITGRVPFDKFLALDLENLGGIKTVVEVGAG
jgi:threonine dehydrogenase-like Zn-dependent dehydrogenase